MSLLNATAAFNPPVNLASWRQALLAEGRWRLILRNFERECDRHDVEPAKWEQFLRDIESEWMVLQARTGLLSPVKAIDDVITRNWQTFLPPGKTLHESDSTMLAKYMRLDKFWTYNLTSLPLSGQSSALAAEITAGNVTAADINGYIGAANRPGWCTTESSVSKRAGANQVRDLAGLKDIEGDWLLEITFPFSLLKSQGLQLHAPTVIDSVAGGAENWIFSKRQPSGGPDWGITVDMSKGSACNPGIPEAVHARFNPAPSPGLSIKLRVAGEITSSPQSVDYPALLGNSAI